MCVYEDASVLSKACLMIALVMCGTCSWYIEYQASLVSLLSSNDEYAESWWLEL